MQALILAGGKGRRLRPYTVSIPKPLLPVGERPILDILLTRLAREGFRTVYISIGYLGEMIRAYVGTGSRYGLRIRYLEESRPLGTAGPLALLPKPKNPFFLLNGDLLLDVDFPAMMKVHREKKNVCTICTYRKEEQVQLGVLRLEDEIVKEYVEKPSYSFHISTGVYVFHPKVCSQIPGGKVLDLPALVNRLLRNKEKVGVYHHDGIWMDLGRFDDYARAEEVFRSDPERFLGRIRGPRRGKARRHAGTEVRR
ncbi:MAG: nucleotidyltransferase family protein [Candidatus Hydrogenedentota bacterium]|nr:MAG: nucleotidyltransferase family protein [Candidatus Hydrogenedentota bacterium]